MLDKFCQLKTVAAIIVTGLLLGQLWAGEKNILVEAVNTLPRMRASETITVKLADLQRLIGEVTPDRLMVQEAASSNDVVSQIIDDILIFQSDFSPRETKRFVIVNKKRGDEAASRVDGRFVLPREDYAWENDRIAFRMYGPALAADVNNGIDVWVKRVRYPIVAKWYAESAAAGKDTYHEDRGEGADFFSVGKTLGAGGSGIWYDGRLWQPGVFTSYRTIANGPVRVVFELKYDGWNIDGKPFSETKRISLDAGQNFNRIDVTFSNLEFADSVTVAVGLVKRKGTHFEKHEEECWMTLWGPTNDNPANGELGIGAWVGGRACMAFVEDDKHFMMLTRIPRTATLTYYAGAGWTRSGDVSSEQEWIEHLRDFRLRVQFPIQVRLQTH